MLGVFFSVSDCDQEELGTLQHLCRRTIVLNLIHKGNYNEGKVSTLHLPQLLIDYLLYKGKNQASSLLKACLELEDKETKLNQLLDEQDPEKTIPRSMYSVGS